MGPPEDKDLLETVLTIASLFVVFFIIPGIFEIGWDDDEASNKREKTTGPVRRGGLRDPDYYNQDPFKVPDMSAWSRFKIFKLNKKKPFSDSEIGVINDYFDFLEITVPESSIKSYEQDRQILRLRREGHTYHSRGRK